MRPCRCEKEGCRLCWLAANDARYQRIWGVAPADKPLPAKLTMLASAARAAGRVALAAVQGRTVKAAPEVKAARLATCASCPERRGDNRCEECGCGLKAKAALATESCPLGKW